MHWGRKAARSARAARRSSLGLRRNRQRVRVQVAEGVATAGALVRMARQYRVSLPVLTAVASVLAEDCTAAQAVQEIMNLPQLEEA